MNYGQWSWYDNKTFNNYVFSKTTFLSFTKIHFVIDGYQLMTNLKDTYPYFQIKI